MSSFFTAPASQRKRKRAEGPAAASKKRNVTSTTKSSARALRRTDREESISGSESSEEEGRDIFSEENEDSGSSGDEGETAADKRLRLAERYLSNIRNEVGEDTIGFDAEEIDRDLIAERLKEDVAETKGKVYRRIAETFDFESASYALGKANLQHGVTACALRLPYVWIVSKDLTVEKWEIADPKTYSNQRLDRPTNVSPRRTPKRLLYRKGNRNKKKDRDFLGHTGPILSIAISDSGRYLATGDATARLIIWDAETLTPRKLFIQHRDAITSVSFRRGTEQLFSASADRTIKIWSASELAYIETLFGHQDTVIGIAGGLEANQETCVSVGARDRTARLWKVVEESQLVFRGGGTARQKGIDKLRKDRFGERPRNDEDARSSAITNGLDEDEDDIPIAYTEGSIDCVAFLDAGLFITGSDNGSLSLWSTQRKKPLSTIPLAHGRDPPIPSEDMSPDGDIKAPKLSRYITALATVPYADLILTASWDGWIRAWRLGHDKRTIEALGRLGRVASGTDSTLSIGTNGIIDAVKPNKEAIGPVRGIINGLAVNERGERGKEGLCIIAATGKTPRLGNWMKRDARNGIVVFEVPKKALTNGASEEDEESDE